jgi:membrane-bound lytic murein transglycosylase D
MGRTGNKIITAALLLTAATVIPSPLHAQRRRGDLDDIERHRKVYQGSPKVQGWSEQENPSTRRLIHTWEFARQADQMESGAQQPPAPAQPQPCAPQVTQPLEDAVMMAMHSSLLQRRLSVLDQRLIVPYREELEHWIAQYIGAYPKALGRALGRFMEHEPEFRDAFGRHGVPQDLTVLAVVESAMNPTALSPAGALGIWQFMSTTAREYGMECSLALDERLDMHKAADAAARHLKDSYERLGSWPLAVAAYNCGTERVARAVATAGTHDYWSVHRLLPAETQGYVPAFTAALYSLYYHDMHGITVTRTEEEPEAVFTVNRRMTFREIAACTGMEMEQIARLNLQYLSGVIPGDRRQCRLRLPRRYAKLFMDNIGIVDK